MFAATAYELLKRAMSATQDGRGSCWAFVVSAVVAFVVREVAVAYVQTHRFTVFAWYRSC